LDRKNVKGSYSALAIMGSGYNGCFYSVPQFGKCFDLRQGMVLFHKSGDTAYGYHGNTGLHLSEGSRSKRIAIVFYMTKLARAQTSPTGPLPDSCEVVNAIVASIFNRVVGDESNSVDDASDNNEEFSVEMILDERVVHKVGGDELQYFVKWENYDTSYNSWEPAENCLNCISKISEYRESKYRTPKQSNDW